MTVNTRVNNESCKYAEADVTSVRLEEILKIAPLSMAEIWTASTIVYGSRLCELVSLLSRNCMLLTHSFVLFYNAL